MNFMCVNVNAQVSGVKKAIARVERQVPPPTCHALCMSGPSESGRPLSSSPALLDTPYLPTSDESRCKEGEGGREEHDRHVHQTLQPAGGRVMTCISAEISAVSQLYLGRISAVSRL